jgi:flagellar protein FliJ
MKPRDTTLRLKRFEASEKARKVASIETMILDFEHMVLDLSRQITAEEERTGIKDAAHFAYSTFAKAAALRRSNLQTSIADLRVKLEAARREHEDAAVELRKLEPVIESRDADRMARKPDGASAVIG